MALLECLLHRVYDPVLPIVGSSQISVRLKKAQLPLIVDELTCKKIGIKRCYLLSHVLEAVKYTCGIQRVGVIPARVNLPWPPSWKQATGML